MAAINGIIIAASWRPYYGNCEQAHHGAIFRRNCVHGKQHIIASIGGQLKDCGHIFFELRGEIDTEWVFTDGSSVCAHQHASGARIGEERAIGKSRGGATTKIHIAADAHGNPIDFEITGSQVHDSQVACKMIEKVGSADHFIGDKGYDSEDIREKARSAKMNPVIPRKINSKRPNPGFDSYLYILIAIESTGNFF